MKSVLLLFGGESSEHEVSMLSARNVAAAIDTKKYTVIYGYIDEIGQWWLVSGIEKATQFSHPILPVFGTSTLIAGEELLSPNVIFPVLHGKNGEDGTIQSVGQLLHIPVVGCGVDASAIGMNKVVAKQLAQSIGVTVVPYEVHHSSEPIPEYAALSTKLSEKMFVKPAGAGSSVGVHSASNQDELAVALEDAHAHDQVVLIEKAVDARELEVAVLGNYPSFEASPVAEVIPEGEFYSFESKYAETSTSVVQIPANISDELSTTVKERAIQLFTVIGGSGMARVDFFIDRTTEELYFNEVNTIPGFTNISVYPKAWEAAGLTYTQLVDKLLTLALERSKPL